MSEQSSSTLTPKEVVEGLTELRDKLCKSKYETPTSLVLDEAITLIKDKRPPAHWIGKDKDSRGYCTHFECSNCGNHIYPHILEKELDFPNCPFCLAHIIEEWDGSMGVAGY